MPPQHGVPGFSRYDEEEAVIDRSPATHSRQPRLDDEAHVAHLGRNELRALVVAAAGAFLPSLHARAHFRPPERSGASASAQSASALFVRAARGAAPQTVELAERLLLLEE